MASKNMNERISFPLNKISVATGHNKELVKNVFPKGRKTASKGRDIWEVGTKLFSLIKN